MTVIDRKSFHVFESASQLYQAGDYDGVLQVLCEAADKNDPRILALVANAHLKLGHTESAADCFVHLADLLKDKRAFFLKSAATLFLKAGSDEKLVTIGAATIRANPSDSKLAFDILQKMNVQSPIEEIEPLIGHLNQSEPEHINFISNFYRERKKDAERSYLTIVKGLEGCPNDGFLRILRFSVARLVSDFPVLRTFDEMMAPPRSPLAEQIFVNQTGLDHLYWADDEREYASSMQDPKRLNRPRLSYSQPRQRRPLRAPGDRLRIGYISNDFGHEVVMSVFRQVIERHDRRKYDIRLFCYSDSEVRKFQQGWPQLLRDEIVSIADLSDEAAAQTIADAEIDILVDLKGHTRGSRLNLMNITGAPVTATYLGYPGSVFGAEIDYLISDLTVTPDSSRPYYAEKLCRLPEVQMPNDALTPLPEMTVRRADCGLPEGRFVFASFNGQQKITPRTIDLWSRILKSVPDAVFWIAAASRFGAHNLLAEFRRLGITEERIIFNEKAPHFLNHIGRLALADLALDTLPYNGHSTTADMLRGGLPVLTVKGKSYHSRVSWSLLKSCGIDELAAEDDEQYCLLAESLARDPARLTEIRKRLWQNRTTSPLFNPDRMARHLERAYEMMADRARNGLPPDHMDVPALP